MEINSDTLIIFGSALAAAASFAAFAYPFLKRSEQKDRYRSVVEKKRKELFIATKEGMDRKKSGNNSISAKDSMATFYKVQKLAGDMGEKARDKMLQAGIRDPSAPLKYMISRTALPVVFGMLAILFMSASEKEIPDAVAFIIILVVSVLGFVLPGVLIKNQIQKRQQDISLSFPDALDMMLICVQGGIGLEQTIHKIAEEIAEHSPLLAEELGILSAEMSMLNDRRAALQDFARRVGSGAARTFATAMIQAEQYGTSVSHAMKVIADELRDMRMQEAERKAMALPPKLTVPMILFFLPALFIVIIGPVCVQISNL